MLPILVWVVFALYALVILAVAGAEIYRVARKDRRIAELEQANARLEAQNEALRSQILRPLPRPESVEESHVRLKAIEAPDDEEETAIWDAPKTQCDGGGHAG